MNGRDWSYKTVEEQEAAEDAEIDRVHAEGITVKVPLNIAICLVAEAVSDDRTPEYIALKLLREWGDKKTKEAFALDEAFRNIREGGLPVGQRKGKTERDYENELANGLQKLGLTVVTQMDSGAGIADIVIYDSGKPVGVIEVKLALKTWRASHQAFGQARAYATALKAKHAWVAAPDIDKRLLSRKAPHILNWETAAETVHSALGGLTLVKP